MGSGEREKEMVDEEVTRKKSTVEENERGNLRMRGFGFSSFKCNSFERVRMIISSDQVTPNNCNETPENAAAVAIFVRLVFSKTNHQR